jgi:hypothetical protein
MPIYAIAAANWEPAGSAPDGGTGSLENAVSRDSAYVGRFGMAYRAQVGEVYQFQTFPIYSGSASGSNGAGGAGALSDVDPASLGCVLSFPAGTESGAEAGCRLNFPSA